LNKNIERKELTAESAKITEKGIEIGLPGVPGKQGLGYLGNIG